LLLPKKTKSSDLEKFQGEQIRLLNLIYQELQKLNYNLVRSSPDPAHKNGIGSDDELEEYE
jgi:hypothetical protein